MTASSHDVEAVRSVVTLLTHHIDGKRWSDLPALFAAEVRTDYTSLFGGTPQQQSGDELVAGWRTTLDKVATQHLLGPVEASIAGSNAGASCHVRAFHQRPDAAGGSEWEVLGHYRFELARKGTEWRITALTLDTLIQTGNRSLLSGG